MDVMFWVWLGVIVVTAIIEFATMEIVSIWFTFGAIIPFIMSTTRSVSWEVQVVVFVIISALLIVCLRSVTKKFLLKNSNTRTNTESLIGKQFRMLERTDFETIGSLKVNDVVWSAVGEKQQKIEKGEIVEVVGVEGNKLIVKKLSSNKVPLDEQVDNNANESKNVATKKKQKENGSVNTEGTQKSNKESSTKSRENSNESKVEKTAKNVQKTRKNGVNLNKNEKTTKKNKEGE